MMAKSMTAEFSQKVDIAYRPFGGDTSNIFIGRIIDAAFTPPEIFTEAERVLYRENPTHIPGVDTN